jgi:Tfp pilus assembly protein PilF
MERLMIIPALVLTILCSCAHLTWASAPAGGGSAAGQEQRSSRSKKQSSSKAVDAISRLQRGDALFAQKEYEAALLFFQGIIDDDPGYWLAYQHAAWALDALERTDEAIQAAEKANSLNESARTHTNLVYYYLKKGQVGRAVSHGRRAVEMDPSAWQTHSALGDATLRSNDFERALAAFERANGIQETGDAWVGIGWAHFYRRQYDQAISSMEKATRLDPSARTELFEVRARIAYFNGCLDQAIAEMTEAIATADYKRRRANLQIDLGKYWLEKGGFTKAAELLGSEIRIGLVISKDVKGFSVQDVDKNSPADLAGIRLDDILVQFEDQPLAGVDPDTFIQGMLGKAALGSIVRLKVDRQGQIMSFPVVAGIVPELPRRAREALADAQPGPPDAAGGAPVATGTAQGPPAGVPSLRILSAAVTPSPVPARGDFQVDIQLLASSPSASSGLPIILNCTISRQGQVLFRSPAENFSAPNGKAVDIHKKLAAGAQPGTYRVRIQLTGEGLTAETAVDFDIR